MRKWLNGTFASTAFTREEYDRILHTSVITQADLDASEQLDKVFLLSEEAVLRYLPTEQDRMAQATPFAIQGGAMVGEGNCCWWLLPHREEYDHPYLKAVWGQGKIQFHSRNVGHRDFCLRPAIRVKMQDVKPVAPGRQRFRKTTEVHCPWKPEIEAELDWQQICKESGLWNVLGSVCTLEADTWIAVAGRELYLFGDQKRICDALQQALEKQYCVKASVTVEQEHLVVELTKIDRERVLLNAKKGYYLTTFTAAKTQLRISVDVEAGIRTRYVLEARAASELALYFLLQKLGHLEDGLQVFFQTHSHQEFAQLLEAQQISYQKKEEEVKYRMIYTDLTQKAMKLCFLAHKNQVDKSGLPYVFHPFHLAEQMPDEYATATALLHDVIEDSLYTLEDLRQMGFPAVVLEALELLTRDEGMPYMDYVARLKPNPIARAVKLADLQHNTDLSRLDKVDEWALARVKKYQKAIELLEA